MVRALFHILARSAGLARRGRAGVLLLVVAGSLGQPVSAQNLLQRFDNMLTEKYNKGNIDTAYIVRPKTKWTAKARFNFSGANIVAEGDDAGQHFTSEMNADCKSTLSFSLGYLGISLSLSLNPAKLMGRYNDYELNINSYGKRFGWDIIYQEAHNFTGWYDHEGMGRLELTPGLLNVKTLNLNAFYALNNRRFSYPAAFSQSYIQRRSAGSFLLAASAMRQHATVNWDLVTDLKMTNIGIGGGYGYNYVPSQGWLLHISALPTFIVYSNTSISFAENSVPLHYHFPEVIITGRGAVVRQKGNHFFGFSMVYNFTNIGNRESLAVDNVKWRVRAFYGLRM